MHDGTKIQAQASGSSFRREKTVRERWERAWRVVEELGDPEDEPKQTRRDAARRRAARGSITEPEAWPMKHGNDGGIAPSYNVQITTDAKKNVIVELGVSQCSSDADVSLREVVKRVENRLDRKPRQVVADGGYTHRNNMVDLAESGVDFAGSLPDTKERQAAAHKSSGVAEEFAGERFQKAPEGPGLICPQGQRLELARQNQKRGHTYEVYQAAGRVCGQCEFHPRCCPKGFEKGRSVSVLIEEAKEVAAMREKMATEAARQAYKKRSEVAETPNAWIKEKFGIRKFRLRGLEKAKTEALWAGLTYNVMQWIRLVWRKGPEAMLQAA